jgi:ABC-type lipoprotein export system ATPase subunit
VLVADEPTGNLDSVTAHQVFDALASLIDRGKTVIYVTHDRELAARASARIELLDGRIISEEGARLVLPTSLAGSEGGDGGGAS